MKLIKVAIFFNFFFLFFGYEITAGQEVTKKIGQFDNWIVYSKSKSLCYIIAQPEKSEGKYTMRGRVRIVVYRNSEKKVKNVLGIDFGYSFPDGSNALIEIDSKKSFKLSTFGQTAWTGSKTKTDEEIINEMIKGNILIAKGKSKRGTDTKDTYSLKGFAKAIKKIRNNCGFD